MIHVNIRGIIERTDRGGREIVVQVRNRNGEPKRFELPGGRINEFESITDALRREVLEETGLKVKEITGEASGVISEGSEGGFTVQCLRPFAVYQTTNGPVDSFGAYFICEAEGELLKAGDDTLNPQWVSREQVRELILKEGAFSDLDKAAVLLYLRGCGE